MPGALAYTDERLNIVFCNRRFKEMYPVPGALLEPGRPYPPFCAIWPTTGTTGEGDIEALVARRVESLRNPSGKSFEDHAPDGRWYRVLRRRVAAGGAVTVITDITDQKRAERDLESKEAELHESLQRRPDPDGLNFRMTRRPNHQMS